MTSARAWVRPSNPAAGPASKSPPLGRRGTGPASPASDRRSRGRACRGAPPPGPRGRIPPGPRHYRRGHGRGSSWDWISTLGPAVARGSGGCPWPQDNPAIATGKRMCKGRTLWQGSALDGPRISTATLRALGISGVEQGLKPGVGPAQAVHHLQAPVEVGLAPGQVPPHRRAARPRRADCRSCPPASPTAPRRLACPACSTWARLRSTLGRALSSVTSRTMAQTSAPKAASSSAAVVCVSSMVSWSRAAQRTAAFRDPSLVAQDLHQGDGVIDVGRGGVVLAPLVAVLACGETQGVDDDRQVGPDDWADLGDRHLGPAPVDDLGYGIIPE